VPDGEAIKILAGTVTGHGGAMLGGSAININSDTTAATIIGHNLGIIKDVAGGTQYGFYSDLEKTGGPPATSLKGTAGFIALNNWDIGFHANTYGYSGTAAFKAEGNWDAAFDGGGLPMKNLGTLWGNQTIYASNASLKVLGGLGEWSMQTVDSNGRFRVYEQTYGELYTISRASPAVHTFTGNAAISGSTTVSSLAGTGSRTVVASSTGLLSAPVSDAKLKRDMTPIAEHVDVLGLLEDSEIRGIFYNWRDPARGTQSEIGFTAQMFEDVPGLTGTMDDTGDAYLNYERITALLWEQNRLLLGQNKALLAQNRALLERVKAIEDVIQVC